jgi:aminoglycoside 2'-N-acetyltransferase I
MAVPLYRRLGWLRWEGRLSALTPDGRVRTPDDEGGVYVLPVAVPPDLAAELTCDWRDGEVW